MESDPPCGAATLSLSDDVSVEGVRMYNLPFVPVTLHEQYVEKSIPCEGLVDVSDI